MKDREDHTSDLQNELSDDSFLNRWSKRKLDARNAAPMAQERSASSLTLNTTSEPTKPEQAGEYHESKAAPPSDADMPHLETLNKDSDYTQFLSPGVSEELRTLALRKLFHLPQFNINDGLNDYDEDYTAFSTLGNIVTHEMTRLRELENKRAAIESKLGKLGEDGDDNITVDLVVKHEQTAANVIGKENPGAVNKDPNSVNVHDPKSTPEMRPDCEKLTG